MFMTMLPTWQAAILIVVLPTLLAVTGPFVVRRFVRLEKLRTNNEVAGFKFATVGVLYAVLLAFVVVVVWQKFNDADNVASQEAGAAATIFRISADLPDEHATHLRAALGNYLNTVTQDEFRTMERGEPSAKTRAALDALYAELLSFKASAPRDAVILGEVLRQLDLMTQTRRARLVASQGVVPGVLWGTLIIGAVGTLAFTLFFGTVNVRAQAMMTGILSVLLFSGLLIVVSFDHPFSGSVRVKPAAFHAVMNDFMK
jgi:hypothetical protein